ncbi:MAG: DUF11 domain-containing protein, partial [Candidatus Dormibacteraeota bacterium]|nr:DUF11 domain-containing protein [Candidatus Dormibacteraeota bacterium]
MWVTLAAMLPRHRRSTLLAPAVAASLLLVASMSALAAGSATLFPNGTSGARANTEWRTNVSGGGVAIRRTLLHAYLVGGEYLVMGSSAMGQGSADILVWDPGLVTGPIGNETIPGTASFSCAAQRSGSGDTNQGVIASRAEELAGSDTVPLGGVTNGYDPCYYQAPSTGIYSIAVVGPAGLNANADGSIGADVGLTNANDFSAAQGSSIAAWDVTVRSDITNASSTQTGRVFTYVLANFTGGNGLPVYSTTYVVTQDGYQYRVDDRGIDPNGWLQYANQVGFLDPDGVTPLDHDAVGAPGPELTSLDGGVQLAPPQFPMFFEPPDNSTLTALGIPLTTTAPGVSNVSFAGSQSGSTSYYSTGGTFSLTASQRGVYQIVISRDGVNFDPTNPLNRVLRAAVPAGVSTASWDGKDNSGNYFPSGASYPFHVTLQGGEYHFAFFDVENDVPGGPTITLLNPPGGTCPALNGGCHAGFYDDRGYTTTSGSTVGTPGSVLCGNGPPSVDHSDPILGFDTSSNQRSFGALSGGNTNAPCTGSFGDDKDLDLWTYFPSAVQSSLLTIVPTADIAVTDMVNNATPNYGTDVTFTVTAADNGPENATGVALSDLLPTGLTYVSSTVTQGSYDPSTGTWTVGAVNNGSNATLTITAQVSSTAQLTDTATKTAEDQTDPVSSNNSASATVNPASADIAVTDAVNNATPSVGINVTFTVTATNDGPSNATGVVITDLLPSGIMFVTAAPAAGTSYNATTGAWSIGPLADGAQKTLLLTGTVTQQGAITDIATRTASSPPDPNPANDRASAVVNAPEADLAITLTAPATLPAGGSGDYAITVTNNGPTPASGPITVTDTLPAGATYT